MARVEPSAAQREAAREMRALYISFTEAGFTASEALELIKAALAGASQRTIGSEDS